MNRSDKGHALSRPPAPPSASEPPLLEHAATQLGPEFVHGGTTWIGRVIDNRYRIVRKLAEGGMGVVYVAEHMTLRKEVAFKLVRSEYADNGEVIARFAREALATAQFEHPHVISAIDYGALPEGGAYFVMQLVRGPSLRQLLHEDGALPYSRVCSLGAQIADALSAAHSSGIVHRDLKPENILIESRDDGGDLVKLLDFGIARIEAGLDDAPVAARPGQALTRVGMVMGTPGYMAPEQAVGGAVDHRADLYALGVVLWESLTGRELWVGDDFTALVTRQMTDEPPAVSTFSREACPAELEQLIQRLLARDIESRPTNAGEVRDELRALSLLSRGPRTVAMQAVELHALRTWTNVRKRTSSWLDRAPALQRGISAASTAFRQLPRRQRIGYGAAAVVLLLALWRLPFGASPAAPAPLLEGTPQAKAVTAAPVAPSASREPSTTEKNPEAATETDRRRGIDPKTVVEDVVTAAVGALRGGKSVPSELRSAQETLFEHDRLRRRRLAARTILDYEPRSAIPAYVLAVAELENERTCAGRRTALEAIAKLKDPRARRSVERYHDSRSGCGIFGTQDCYGCNRRDLEATLEALRD